MLIVSYCLIQIAPTLPNLQFVLYNVYSTFLHNDPSHKYTYRYIYDKLKFTLRLDNENPQKMEATCFLPLFHGLAKTDDAVDKDGLDAAAVLYAFDTVDAILGFGGKGDPTATHRRLTLGRIDRPRIFPMTDADLTAFVLHDNDLEINGEHETT